MQRATKVGKYFWQSQARFQGVVGVKSMVSGRIQGLDKSLLKEAKLPKTIKHSVNKIKAAKWQSTTN